MFSGQDTPATATAKQMDKMDIASSSSAAGGPPVPPEWSHTCSYNYRYEKVLGTGSYGEVAKAVHTPTGQVVAIKKVKGVFQDRHDARCILRELCILRQARHPQSEPGVHADLSRTPFERVQCPSAKV